MSRQSCLSEKRKRKKKNNQKNFHLDEPEKIFKAKKCLLQFSQEQKNDPIISRTHGEQQSPRTKLISWHGQVMEEQRALCNKCGYSQENSIDHLPQRKFIRSAINFVPKLSEKEMNSEVKHKIQQAQHRRLKKKEKEISRKQLISSVVTVVPYAHFQKQEIRKRKKKKIRSQIFSQTKLDRFTIKSGLNTSIDNSKRNELKVFKEPLKIKKHSKVVETQPNLTKKEEKVKFFGTLFGDNFHLKSQNFQKHWNTSNFVKLQRQIRQQREAFRIQQLISKCFN